MQTRPSRLLATALVVALVATASVAGVTTAQPSEETPSAEFDGELTLTNGNGQWIAGTTTLDEGTEIIVEIRGENDVREPERVTVGSDGSFDARFDLQQFEAGTEYTAVVLARNGSGGWEQINDGATGTIAAAPIGSFTSDGTTLTVSNTSDATISGETSLEAGAEVNVRIRSTNGASDPFLHTDTATVAEDGTFTATFDLSNVPANTSFVATARSDAGELEESEGLVVDGSSTVTSTTAEPTETAETTETADTTNDAGQPGFGVAAALVALAGAALLARRD